MTDEKVDNAQSEQLMELSLPRWVGKVVLFVWLPLAVLAMLARGIAVFGNPPVLEQVSAIVGSVGFCLGFSLPSLAFFGFGMQSGNLSNKWLCYAVAVILLAIPVILVPRIM